MCRQCHLPYDRRLGAALRALYDRFEIKDERINEVELKCQW